MRQQFGVSVMNLLHPELPPTLRAQDGNTGQLPYRVGKGMHMADIAGLSQRPEGELEHAIFGVRDPDTFGLGEFGS